MYIYLNGKLPHSEKNKTHIISTTSARDLADIVVVAGKLAEVCMWRTALSPDKIMYYMNVQPTNRFWRYLPFRSGTIETLQQILTDPQAIKAYNDDPFAIAQVRFGEPKS